MCAFFVLPAGLCLHRWNPIAYAECMTACDEVRICVMRSAYV